MKTLTKRNALLIVLSLVVAICSLIFTATVKNAKAEQPVVNNVSVVEAASIRVGLKENEYSGIRFRVTLNEATKNNIVNNDNVQLGFIITPKHYFDKAIKEGYTDYLNQMVKDKYPDQAAYVGDKGVGILADETKIYEDAKTAGVFYANAAIENIQDANKNLQFTMIAYLKTGSTIEYFLPADTTFARTYLQTAKSAYMKGDVSLEIMRQSKDDYLQTFATASNPIEIVDGDDLYDISQNVNGLNDNANGYAGAHFIIINDLTVGYGFEQISADFEGVIDANDRTITVTNNRNLTSVFANPEIVVDTVVSQNLFDVDKFAEKAVYFTSDSGYYYADFVKNAGTMEGFVNPHEKDALKSTLFVNGSEVVIKSNYTKSEVEAMKETNPNLGVKITFMGANGSSAYNDGAKNVLAYLGYPGGDKTATSYVRNTWHTHMITLDDYINSFLDNGTDVIITQGFGEFDFYLASIEFAEWDLYKGDVDFVASETNKERIICTSDNIEPEFISDYSSENTSTAQ